MDAAWTTWGPKHRTSQLLRYSPRSTSPQDPKDILSPRPVVAAASGLSSRAGDCLADFLEPLVNVETPRMEDRSTEEVLSQLQEAEVSIRDQGLTDTMVGSLDVRALYPSLDQEGSARAVARFVLESNVEISGVDWRAAQIFVASNLTQEQVVAEGISEIVPRRLHKKGKRPRATTDELRMKRSNPASVPEEEPGQAWGPGGVAPNPVRVVPRPVPQPSKWAETDTSTLTSMQRRLLLSMVMLVAVRIIFFHHQYQFAGTTYRQSTGAPIGLRLTSIVARIIMDQWMKVFLSKVDKAGIGVHAALKYVDNVNLVLSMLPLGSRWKNDSVSWCKEWELADKVLGKSQEMSTMECVRDAADSVVPWLSFTLDLPELHVSKTVPMLDLQVWVVHPSKDEDGLGADLVCWMFFEKTSASSKVLRASSAYTWRNKLVTMANEVFRRMRNSSRQLTLKTKLGLMTTFTDKMRNSGYSQGSVNGILESGLQHYYRKLVVDLQGGPKINRRNDTNEMETRRKKMTTKNTWFRKRGGQSAKETKDNGWRTNQRLGGGSGGWCPAHLRAHVAPGLQVVEKEAIEPQRKVILTLLVPYSVGSALQKAVQDAEDTFSKLTGAERVRVVEKGGDTLLNTLGRNDPWSAGRSCGDPRCPQCQSMSLLKVLKKDAKKAGMELPQGLLTQTSHQCRREGQNYGAQCAECLLNLGRSSTYWGETSRSGRQRMKEHVQDLDRSNVSSPLVMHAVQEHGGVRPNYIFTTAAVEPRPLYRAVRESVQIGSQPWGPDNLNRCQEWGVPRVPILSVLGGDVGVPVKPGRDNPRPGWTADTMTSIVGVYVNKPGRKASSIISVMRVTRRWPLCSGTGGNK